jgi:hypothetical protein
MRMSEDLRRKTDRLIEQLEHLDSGNVFEFFGDDVADEMVRLSVAFKDELEKASLSENFEKAV